MDQPFDGTRAERLTLPRTHEQRAALHNEVHARPPEAMAAPLAISHVVMLCDGEERAHSREHLAALLRDHHLPPPDEHGTHVRTELPGFRLRWELHTEFVTWTFSRPMADALLREPREAIEPVPREWLRVLPGRVLCAMHVWVLPGGPADGGPHPKALLNEETLVGARVGDGACEAFTDFALHADGFSRMLLFAGSARPRQLGRLVQQLLEIETYRMAALLGLPAARGAAAVLGDAECELAELAAAIRAAGRDQEPQLLDRLTRLAAKVESHYAATHARFSASAAYFELVDRRIADVGESPLPGLQTIREFMNRRLSPAAATCAWAVRRQSALSERVSRISNLLRTRVEIEQQQSSQGLLGAMNRRQGLQLKLQATVEGLSVAAITYYIAGLVAYLAKGAAGLGWPYSGEASAAVAIPVIAFAVWWSLRRLHARVLEG
ncbi:DUF3422 domain-containing protein [Ramlibacter henchirensis]|uniref:DUF3422 domain-containing protein n=1 Tax=Ramlibacter henchirensis TaxID=204072 RepID=A0A4Z0C3X8_9BURK|nr:DUF3422 domain-containing protein [Ramlibacter henchirensis]TFZ05652.1 DUF3422 domain-containing protein [Ramlibacter henchirensis]